MPYFEKLAKLSIGSLATLAIPFDPTSVVNPVRPAGAMSVSIVPNPTTSDAQLLISAPRTGRYSLRLTNTLGQVVRYGSVGTLVKGTNQLPLALADLPAGTYNVLVSDELGMVAAQRVVRSW